MTDFTWNADDLNVADGFSRLQTIIYELQQVAKTLGFDLFGTVSEANSAGGTEGDSAIIVGDTAANNGYYARTGGTWVRKGPLGGIGLDVSTYMAGLLEDEDASAALATLGIGATGAALFAAASQSAARTAIGATATGSSLITAADAAAAKTTLALNNVNNTSDASKPVSTAQQTALDAKLNTSQTTAYSRTILDDADAAAARTTLGATTTGAALFTASTAATARATLATNDSIASAATLNVYAGGASRYAVTGTTAITALDTAPAGYVVDLRFSAALTLTHNGTSLILPTGANITTAAGDAARFISLGSGNWYCAEYQRASGKALVGATTTTELTDMTSVGRALATAADIAAAQAILGIAPAFDDYSEGLAATLEGGTFAYAWRGRKLTYTKTGGVGVLTTVEPLDVDQGVRVLEAVDAVNTGLAPATILDVNGIDQFYGLTTRTRNRATTTEAEFSPLNLLDTDDLNAGSNKHALLTTSGTITTDQTDGAGGTTAVRMSGGSVRLQNIPMPPGQWTLRARIKSNSGTVDFGFGIGNFFSTANATVGTSWTVISHTAHLTAESLQICTLGWQVSDAVDLTIGEVALVAGGGTSYDIAETSLCRFDQWVPFEGYAFDGANNTQSAGTAATSQYKTLNFPGGKSFSAMTFGMYLKADTVNSDRDIIQALEGAGPILGIRPYGLYAAGLSGSAVNGIGAKVPAGYYASAIVTIGTSVKMYIDGVLAYEASGTGINGASVLEEARLFGHNSVGSRYVDGEITSVWMTEAELTKAQCLNLHNMLRQRALAQRKTLVPLPAWGIFDGDSITQGYFTGAADRFSGLAAINRSDLPTINYAVSGDRWSDLAGRLSTLLAKGQEVQAAGSTPIAVLLAGINDIHTGGLDTEGEIDTLFSGTIYPYLDALKADGWRIVLGTLIPMQTASTAQSDARAYFNAKIEDATTATRIDAVADYAGATEFAAWSGTYYDDPYHPNEAGHAALYAVLGPVLNGLY